MTIRICEKWEMQTPVAKHNEWFADWALRKPHEVSRHLTMGYHAIQELSFLDDVKSVHESFGGMGGQALMVEEMWPEAHHTIYDFSVSASNYMIENLPIRDGLKIYNADAYQPLNFVTADVQIADVGDLTAVRWNLKPYKAFLDHTFGSGARAVVITDIAGRLLHLHRPTYSASLETPIHTYEEYLFALSERVTRRYGYYPVATFYHSWSAIQVFVPFDTLGLGDHLAPAPTTPRGLEIL